MFIKTLIRKKRLALAESQQQLSHLQLEERRQRELIEFQNTIVQKEKERLNGQLAASGEISVQQLILAKAYVGKIERSLNDMNREMAAQKQAITQLEEHTKRSNKEIDKLEELAQERLRELQSEQISREWQALDQWVINRRGDKS